MILLRIRGRPTTKELVFCGDSSLDIVLDRPERKVAADVRVIGCEH